MLWDTLGSSLRELFLPYKFCPINFVQYHKFSANSYLGFIFFGVRLGQFLGRALRLGMPGGAAAMTVKGGANAAAT